MEYGRNKKVQSTILWTIFYSLQIQVCFTVGNPQQNVTGVMAQSPIPSNPSSYYFLVEGNALENGFFHAVVHVGKELKEFYLDIDTGSDLIWITCSPDNIKFLKPFSIYSTPHDPYTTSNNLLSCEDGAICGLVEKPINPQCSQQNQQCDYQVEYADHGSTLGVLVKDLFLFSSSLKINPSQSTHTLIFGCGYHQEFDDSFPSPFTDGVLGLGTGKTSMLSQLSDQGLIKKVMALCLSEINPGYLVLGDSKSNLPETIWMPFSNDHIEPYNMLGPADLLYNGNLLASGLLFLLDSGTTYNYFSPTLYQDVLSLVKELAEKTAAPIEDSYLPVCWRPFASSNDFLYSFSSLNLSFTGNNNVYFELAPTDYLIVSPLDNVCLGILESQVLGPDFENLNIIGDISVLWKLVIYDYENGKIGWNYANCNELPEQLSATGPTKQSRKTKKGKWHKGKDIARWHTKKKRKLESNSP